MSKSIQRIVIFAGCDKLFTTLWILVFIMDGHPYLHENKFTFLLLFILVLQSQHLKKIMN